LWLIVSSAGLSSGTRTERGAVKEGPLFSLLVDPAPPVAAHASAHCLDLGIQGLSESYHFDTDEVDMRIARVVTTLGPGSLV